MHSKRQISGEVEDFSMAQRRNIFETMYDTSLTGCDTKESYDSPINI